MSLFFVDSNSDLLLSDIRKLGIESVNFAYSINNEKMTFDEDFDYAKFYSKFKKGVCVQSYAYSYEQYVECFEMALKQNDDIVYVHSSKELIDYENLEKAKKDLLKKYPDRRIELIDSKNISIGQGMISYECAMRYRKGATIDEIVTESEILKNEYTTYLLLDTMENLSNHYSLDSGFVSGTALNVKSIVTLDFDGKFDLVEKTSGKKKGITKLIDYIRQTGKNVADYPIGIVYSGSDVDAKNLKDKILELFGEETKVIVSSMSPSNTAIFGNNAIGISFHVHKKNH